MTDPNEDPTAGPGAPSIVLAMLLLVVVGGPLVYVLWGAVNDVLLGEPGRVHLAVVLPAFIAFVVVVFFVARLVRRWEYQ